MIWNWIKDLFLSEPDYIKNSTKPKRVPTMVKNVEYQYPPRKKEEIGFSVIPENDKKVRERRRNVSSRQEGNSSLVKVNPFEGKERLKPAPKEMPKPKIKVSKSPFVARDIPSPIHGFLQRSSDSHTVVQQEIEAGTDETLIKGDELNEFDRLEMKGEFSLKENVKAENGDRQEEGVLVREVQTDLKDSRDLELYEKPVEGIVEKESFELEESYEGKTLVEDGGSGSSSAKLDYESSYNYDVSMEIEEDIIDLSGEVRQEDEIKDSIEEVGVREDGQHRVADQDNSEEQDIIDDSILKEEEEVKVNRNFNKEGYIHPPLHMLNEPAFKDDDDQSWLLEQKERLGQSLNDFHVKAEVIEMQQGPSITRFEVQPAPGVKVNKITNLSDDLKLSLSAKDIRIQAPIPGKSSVGIEIPNQESRPVLLREVLESKEFESKESPLTVALGMDISGTPIVTDLGKMPHGLIAGATGSGKSVCINTILMSLLYKSSPEEVKLLLVDPKMVELTPYNDLPHLVSPVITDPKAATKALKWAVQEMENRYQRFVKAKVRDIGKYNEKAEKYGEEKMPYIVIVIDELADLMMVSPTDVEDAICRIAQKARACGIHLLVATQRPSVDVITGLIKANIPTRIAFAVSSQTDSRTILDEGGAEKLLGKGDMLFAGNGAKSVRLQGNFVSDDEIEEVTEFVKAQQEPDFLFEQGELVEQESSLDSEDELFLEACEFVIEQGSASSSGLQRKFRVGYNRAARLIDMMEDKGIVSAPNGSKPREILISMEQFFEKI